MRQGMFRLVINFVKGLNHRANKWERIYTQARNTNTMQPNTQTVYHCITFSVSPSPGGK